jgi:chromosome segregation ATPase
MSSDHLTRKMADEDDKETQPTITAVFRLLQGVESRLNTRLDGVTARIDEIETRFNARLDKTDARLDEIETRLARDIEGVNTRVTEGFKELTHKTNALNRRALQAEADYEDLFERMGRLESKAS